jgi:hypothetical protein
MERRNYESAVKQATSVHELYLRISKDLEKDPRDPNLPMIQKEGKDLLCNILVQVLNYRPEIYPPSYRELLALSEKLPNPTPKLSESIEKAKRDLKASHQCPFEFA